MSGLVDSCLEENIWLIGSGRDPTTLDLIDKTKKRPFKVAPLEKVDERHARVVDRVDSAHLRVIEKMEVAAEAAIIAA